MGLLEELGRRADRADSIQEEYDKLYTLLCDLVTGAKFVKDIAVSTMNKSWVWTAPIPTMAETRIPQEILDRMNGQQEHSPESYLDSQ